MVPLTALWLPVLVAAVLVFLVSSLLHMVLKYHRADYGQVPAEGRLMDTLRPFSIPPGDYMVPCPGMGSPQAPEFMERMQKGPVVLMTVLPAGATGMAGSLVAWFLYSVVVGLFAGYLSSRALPAGAPGLEVFRFPSTVAFAGYALALWQHTIWYKRSWLATLRSTIDGFIYAVLTGGAFVWLWP